MRDYTLTGNGKAVIHNENVPIPYEVSVKGIRWLRSRRIAEAMAMRTNHHIFIPYPPTYFECRTRSDNWKPYNRHSEMWWTARWGKCIVRRMTGDTE